MKLNHCLAGLLLSAVMWAAPAPDSLLVKFENPPREAGVRVWWHWIDGNITQDGIKKDLDWMHQSGIVGFHQFDAGGVMGEKSIVPRIPYMGKEWKDAFRYAINYADSLGMEVAIASAPGWSATGGPWVEPEDGMKKLTWRTLEVDGKGRKQRISLPAPFTNPGTFQNLETIKNVEPWYEDVAVVAVKLPAEDRPLEPVSVQEGEDWLQYSFREPVSAEALTLVGGAGRNIWAMTDPTYENSLLCSQDGISWQEVCRIPSSSLAQQTIDFPRTSARYFRLQVKRKDRVKDWTLHPVARINHAEEKAGFSAPHDLRAYPTPESAFPAAETVDLSAFVKDGTLVWTVPKGRWRIYRFGASLTGKKNHPAPPEATGLEVDKLDREAWEEYFHEYLDLYKEAAGGMLGPRGIRYLLTDSYEAGQMTWTPTLPETFLRDRGYNLIPWLPVVAGEIVKSSEESERFLFDWRITLGEMLAANYDYINKITEDYGMAGRYTESQENGRVFIGDGMDLKRTAQVPMSALWVHGTSRTMGQADIRESASVAHLYGQNIVALEALTAAGRDENAWSYYPGNLKETADLALYSGVNRFYIHESSHQPSDKHKPGLDLLAYGQWFNRHETWAPYARYWTDYLARSCYMLQQGSYVADVLWLYGEDTNITGVYGKKLPEVPEGYSYDFVSPHALMNLVEAKDGRLVTESGMSYKLLYLGEACREMSLPLLRKIAELAKSGVLICGVRPQRPASLTDDPKEFSRLARELWSRGNVSWRPLKDVLASTVAPDFTYSWPSRISFVHRKTSDRDIYWIRNFSDKPAFPSVSFRDGKGSCTVLDPESGKVLSGVYDGSHLCLEPSQALFLVFGPEAGVPEKALYKGQLLVPDSPWTVSFDGTAAPEGEYSFDKLTSYTESDNPSIKYFSGTATYRTSFTVDKAAEGLVIDLGAVGQMADVSLNGRHVDFLWKAPYRAEWREPLPAGRNELEIKVVNTWANRLIGDEQPGAVKSTYTTIPFYKASSALTPSGLMGPVRLWEGNQTPDTLRILSVANSFGVDAVEQNLHEIALADGHVLIIGNMYIGGCSLERHYNNARSGKAAYSYRKVSADGVLTTRENTSLPYAFKDEPWDVVVFQQVSQLSGVVDSYEPYLGYMIRYAKKRCKKDVRMYLHQTWAYSEDSTHPNFPDYDRDQQKMYRLLSDAYSRMAAKHSLGVIPSGTAIQNARQTFLKGRLTRDGFHLSYGLGRYIAAAAYYGALYGTSVEENGWVPPYLDGASLTAARRAVDDALKTPFQVTVPEKD